MSSALTEWNEQFGDVEFFPEKQSGGFNFEHEVAYACRIKTARCVRNKLGDLQIEIQFDIKSDGTDDADTVGSSRVWLDLPKQPSDMGKDRELVIKLTQRRYQNLLRVLSAAAPARYALYAERKGYPKNYTFLDFDGEKMDGSDFNERKEEIHARCIKFADEVEENQDIELLAETLIYIEKRNNPKNEKYPFVNYYAREPEEVKVFKGSSSTPF